MSERTRCDPQAMVVVHRAVRGGLARLPELIRSVAAVDAERTRVVVAHADGLLGLLTHHNATEDELVWPVLRARVDVDGRLVERMEAQHERIAEIVDRVEPLLHRYAVARGDYRNRLTDQLELLTIAVEEHFDDEEQLILPIVARTFTSSQWRAVVQRAMTVAPRARQAVVLGHLLAGADATERAALLSTVARTTRLGYLLGGRRTYHREIAALRGRVRG